MEKVTPSLKNVLSNMRPDIKKGNYVFVSTNDIKKIAKKHVYAMVKEKGGVSLIVPKKYAKKKGLEYEIVTKWITLGVESSLNLVGLTAVITTELTRNNISCNVVAGHKYDHLFVAKNDAQKVIRILKTLSEGTTNDVL